jgi:hypothetical protein
MLSTIPRLSRTREYIDTPQALGYSQPCPTPRALHRGASCTQSKGPRHRLPPADSPGRQVPAVADDASMGRGGSGLVWSDRFNIVATEAPSGEGQSSRCRSPKLSSKASRSEPSRSVSLSRTRAHGDSVKPGLAHYRRRCPSPVNPFSDLGGERGDELKLAVDGGDLVGVAEPTAPAGSWSAHRGASLRSAVRRSSPTLGSPGDGTQRAVCLVLLRRDPNRRSHGHRNDICGEQLRGDLRGVPARWFACSISARATAR